MTFAVRKSNIFLYMRTSSIQTNLFGPSLITVYIYMNELGHSASYKIACVHRQDSYQPSHPRRPICLRGALRG